MFHRNHCLAWSLKAILRCVCTVRNLQYQSTIISVFPWFVVILVCFVVSVFAHLARQHIYMSLAHSPHVHLCLTCLHCAFSNVSSNVPTPPMCTNVSPLCVFLKCAHASMFTHSHGSQYSFTAQLDLGCFLSISFFCLSLVFHLYKC